MEQIPHPFSQLFLQLGLPADAQSICGFIEKHRPLPAGVDLSQAPFWTPAQAGFLCESLGADAEWSEVADQLSLALRVE